MKTRRLFEPGDLVVSFTGDVGVVVSRDTLHDLRARFKEGNRPGHFFAPGCCQNPDYVTQVPVFFDDGTFDVMRAMNVRRRKDLPDAKRKDLESMMSSGLEPSESLRRHPKPSGEPVDGEVSS
jgi:hypothetical protein